MSYQVGDIILIRAEVVESRDRGAIGLKAAKQVFLLSALTLDAVVETRRVLTASEESLLGAYSELRDDNVALIETRRHTEEALAAAVAEVDRLKARVAELEAPPA